MNARDFIKIRKKELKLSNRIIAEKLNVNKSTIARFISGSIKKLPRESLNPLKTILQCDINDLLDDDDSTELVMKKINITTEEENHIKKYRACDERGREIINNVLEYEYNRSTDVSKIEENKKLLKIIKVYFEAATAGKGNYLFDDSYEEIEFSSEDIPRMTDFGIRIAGNSMSPSIPDGCVAFVRSCPAIETGKIGIFSLNGEGFCKRLEVDSTKRTIKLLSDNPMYEPIIVKSDDYLYTYGEVLGWK